MTHPGADYFISGPGAPTADDEHRDAVEKAARILRPFERLVACCLEIAENGSETDSKLATEALDEWRKAMKDLDLPKAARSSAPEEPQRTITMTCKVCGWEGKIEHPADPCPGCAAREDECVMIGCDRPKSAGNFCVVHGIVGIDTPPDASTDCCTPSCDRAATHDVGPFPLCDECYADFGRHMQGESPVEKDIPIPWHEQSINAPDDVEHAADGGWGELAEKGWQNYHSLAAAYEAPTHTRGPIEGCAAPTCRFFVGARRNLIRSAPEAEHDERDAYQRGYRAHLDYLRELTPTMLAAYLKAVFVTSHEPATTPRTVKDGDPAIGIGYMSVQPSPGSAGGDREDLRWALNELSMRVSVPTVLDRVRRIRERAFPTSQPAAEGTD